MRKLLSPARLGNLRCRLNVSNLIAATAQAKGKIAETELQVIRVDQDVPYARIFAIVAVVERFGSNTASTTLPP